MSLLNLLILLDIVNKLALGVMTSIQVWAVAITLIRILRNDSTEVLLVTTRVTLSLLAFVACAVVTIFDILLLLELL